jgi:hypothetical protein
MFTARRSPLIDPSWRSWENRVTAVATLFWVIYVIGTNAFGKSFQYMHWYEKPLFVFVAFGQAIAERSNLYPHDLGGIQFFSALGAMAVVTRLLLWAVPIRAAEAD